MKHRDTASGMVLRPELGDYCWTYMIYVDCKNCRQDATIGSIDGTDEPILKCNHCGWTEKLAGQKYETLIAGIKRGIAGN